MQHQLFSHYFNGHKLAFNETYPDLSVTPLQPELNSKGNTGKKKKRKKTENQIKFSKKRGKKRKGTACMPLHSKQLLNWTVRAKNLFLLKCFFFSLF